jgi:hypothetical protein
MPRNQKLTDTQLILLSTAAQRDGGDLLPPPESLGDYTPRLTKAVATLIKKKLVIETENATGATTWRTDGDLRFGAAISAAGRATIGIEGDQSPDVEDRENTRSDDKAEPVPDRLSPVTSTRPASKQAQVVDLMQRDGGATLDELVAATGWLPHTTRAALTGLRKKGHLISRDKRGEVTCYRIKAAG